ncbi:MAG: altronate dehydrogenase [Planctomycetes bacterium]|nr:altronate dehydrogenase [Planctomycetota bacterium]
MTPLPETILQFGAGRFLRAFVDRFVHQANERGQNVGRIVVVQRGADQRSELLGPDGYDVLVRGYQNNELVQRRERVQSISRMLVADTQWADVLAFAKSPDLRYIVSNATESSYVLDARDQLDSAPPDSIAGKLTQVLWSRFQAGGAPLTLLPCELIECNADKLSQLVVMQSYAWGLSDGFRTWIKEECVWLNSLVDCIVTMPEPALAQKEPLLVCAEPYYLWALENPSGKSVKLFDHPAIRLADDISPFFLRKVRILNGTHTAMVGKFLGKFETVQKLLEDRSANRWIRDLMYGEIVPTLAYRVDQVAAFADETYDRFRNPFTNHKLADIAKGHADKVRERLQRTRAEYEKLFGKPPPLLVEAMKPI